MTTEIKEALNQCIDQQKELEKTYPSQVRSKNLSILVLMAAKGHVPQGDQDRKEWLEYVTVNAR